MAALSCSYPLSPTWLSRTAVALVFLARCAPFFAALLSNRTVFRLFFLSTSLPLLGHRLLDYTTTLPSVVDVVVSLCLITSC